LPVGGYEHKRVWQYRFRPQPAALLDRAWGCDQAWEHSVVERLRRGEAALRSLSVEEVIPSRDGESMSGGWEIAEERSKNAVRTGAAFLNDAAIERRLYDRGLRKKAWAEYLAAQAVLTEKKRARRAEKEAAEAEAERVHRKKAAERARVEAEREAEWQRSNAERIDALKNDRAAFERALFLLEKRQGP
jgi:hypothetical protein